MGLGGGGGACGGSGLLLVGESTGKRRDGVPVGKSTASVREPRS